MATIEAVVKTFHGVGDCQGYFWRFWGMHSRPPFPAPFLYNLTAEARDQGLDVGDDFRLQAWNPFVETMPDGSPAPAQAKATRSSAYLTFRYALQSTSCLNARSPLSLPTPSLSFPVTPACPRLVRSACAKVLIPCDIFVPPRCLQSGRVFRAPEIRKRNP